MRGLRPIPARLLADDAVVRVPDGAGGYAEGVDTSHVRFARTQFVMDDGHRSADAGAGKVYVDALNSAGAFEVPAGSSIDIGGHSYCVAECRRCEDFNGQTHRYAPWQALPQHGNVLRPCRQCSQMARTAVSARQQKK